MSRFATAPSLTPSRWKNRDESASAVDPAILPYLDSVPIRLLPLLPPVTRIYCKWTIVEFCCIERCATVVPDYQAGCVSGVSGVPSYKFPVCLFFHNRHPTTFAPRAAADTHSAEAQLRVPATLACPGGAQGRRGSANLAASATRQEV